MTDPYRWVDPWEEIEEAETMRQEAWQEVSNLDALLERSQDNSERLLKYILPEVALWAIAIGIVIGSAFL